MRLLDRYLLRELLVPLGYCLAGFLIFYVAFDLIFDLHQYLDKRMFFTDIVQYYCLTVPEMLVDQVLPVSLLLALLYALTSHSRHNELTAMRAAGISLWRLAVPYLAVGAVFGAAVFLVSEYWLPSSAERARFLQERRLHPRMRADWLPSLEFYNPADHRHWVSGPFDFKTSEVIHPVVTTDTPAGAVLQVIDAQRAVFNGGQWAFYDALVWDHGLEAGSVSNAEVRVTLPETPRWIRGEIKINSLNATEAAKPLQLSIAEILAYLRSHPEINRDRRAMLETQLQGRLASPFTCMAVVLIALPFGTRPGRHNVFVGVASSIFICFAYIMLQRVSFGLGTGGYLPPVVAAWLPNLACAAAGVGLLAWYR